MMTMTIIRKKHNNDKDNDNSIDNSNGDYDENNDNGIYQTLALIGYIGKIIYIF